MLPPIVQSVLVLKLAFLVSALRSTPHRRASIQNGQGVWTRNEMIGQGPRQEHGAAVLDQDIYIVGGVDYNNSYDIDTVNRVEYYRTTTQTWHVAAPLPQAVNHPNVAGVDGLLYVLGALGPGGNWTAMPESYAYNPFNDTWKDIAPQPNGTARGASAVGVYKDTVYLAGGMQFLEIITPYQQNSVSLVSAYNTTTNTWDTNFPPLPEPRQHVGGAVVGSTFYVIGGREDGVDEYHNTTYALDLNNPAGWKTLSPMPTARGSVACAAIGQYIYCFGGEGNPDNAQHIFNETEAYNTATDIWYELAPMEVPRHGTAAVPLGGSAYIPGGGATTAMFPVGIFDTFDP